MRALRVRAFAALCIFFGSLSVVPQQASAHVPRSERVIDAVASANVSGRRVRALRYSLKLHIGEGPPVATGDLVSHPTGLARLELRAGGGLVERHILLGDQHSAARNARLLVRPRAFLPPIFVLQSNSGAVLEAALGTLGVDREFLGLAPCGENDCYVIGDPKRAVRRPRLAAPALIDDQGDGQADADEPLAVADVDNAPGTGSEAELETDPPIQLPPPADPQDAADAPDEFFASLWVDTVDHMVRQIETRDGVRIVLGPYVSFERLSVPQWWSIEEPGKRPVRFEVEGVIEVNAPAAAFSMTWLMAPVLGVNPEPPAPVEAAPPGPDGAPQPDPSTIPPSETVPGSDQIPITQDL